MVGQKKVRTMPYDPRRPHAERYLKDFARPRTLHARLLWRKMEEDAIKLCRALGYDLNSVEFAVKEGTPYAIDFMNPVPDADVHSVGETNFAWIVDQVAELAITRARSAPRVAGQRGPSYLGLAHAKAGSRKRPAARKRPASEAGDAKTSGA